jgi:hypothetical protein
MSLFNIILTPTLRDEIVATQKTDESMGHIKRTMQEGDPKVACFCEDQDRMVQGNIGCAQERSFEEEDSGWSTYVKVLHSSREH